MKKWCRCRWSSCLEWDSAEVVRALVRAEFDRQQIETLFRQQTAGLQSGNEEGPDYEPHTRMRCTSTIRSFPR